MLHVRIVGVLILLCAVSAVARAGEKQQAEARVLFEAGREQYQTEHFEEAYGLFKRAYLLSAKPELLYNMASSLRALGRPSEAAEEFRAYLRANPTATDRSVVEDQILALTEAQRLLTPPAGPQLTLQTPAPAERPGAKKRRTLVIVLSTLGALAVAGAAVGIGLAFGLHEDPTASTLGVHAGTR